jgi:hypothetical protein
VIHASCGVDTPKTGGIPAAIFAPRLPYFVVKSGSAVEVSKLSRAVETHKSRIHRHLRTRVAAGYTVRDAATERDRASARLAAPGPAERDGVRMAMVLARRADIAIAGKPGASRNMHPSVHGKEALAFGNPEPRLMPSSTTPG